MKPVQTPQAMPGAPVRVEFQVEFSGGPRGRRARKETTTAAEKGVTTAATDTPEPEPVEEVSFGRLPKITQLLVLGHHFEKLIRDGVVKDYAEIASLKGLSRARVTQITNLTLLAPDIQEGILHLLGRPSRSTATAPRERDLRPLISVPSWPSQRLRHHPVE